MAKYALINNTKKFIVSLHETSEEAVKIGEAADYDFAVANTTDWNGHTAADLACYHNDLAEEQHKVAKFSDRQTAIRRLNDKLHLVGTRAPGPRRRKPTSSGAGRSPKFSIVEVMGDATKGLDGLGMHQDAPRFKVLEQISKHGPIEVSQLISKFPDLERGQVLGCIQKLRVKKLIKGS